MKQSNTYLNVPLVWHSKILGFSSLPHEHQTDTPTLRAWSAHKSIALLVWLLCCCFVPTTALYAQTQFITKWDLSKTGASTTALTFGVQVASTGTATYTWSTVPAGTSGSGTMAASATSVTISGLPAGAIIEVKINPTSFQRININLGSDRARLVDVSQWGTTAWTSMENAFRACNNLANITATDVPTLTGVTDMSNMFRSCTLLNGPSNIGTWNTAAVTNMTYMFYNATAFNQNIGTWNVAAVTNMSYMLSYATAFNQSLAGWGTKFNAAVILTNCLDNCGMSIANYEATLAGFALTTRTGRSLGALGLKYCNASARTILTNTVASGGKGWTITGDAQDCATATFVTRWDLSKTGASTTALTFGVQVASTGTATYTWSTVPAGTSGSGTMAASATSVTISGLPAGAMIEVKINPTNFQRININQGIDKARLIDVSQWGTTAWTSMANAFYGCNNLANITATDVPNLAGVMNMTSMFLSCSVLNGPSNIGTWNTAAVTNMSYVFYDATVFNQNIGAWNTTKVTDMSHIFRDATAFNQNIGSWTTTAVTDMSNMFRGATAFNQNIGSWTTTAVTNMSSMFGGATAFNQNIGSWTTTAVTSMSGMFGSATAFNQNIGTWNVAAVTDMSFMFYAAPAFNQNIGTWNVAAVTNMSYMLSDATAFNQSLAGWGTKFNAAVNLTNCLDNCGMSMTNYEATLAGFALTTRTLRTLGALGLKYCNASARTILTNTVASGGKGWTITGDVQDCATANFVTKWDLSKTGASTTALTFGVVVASTGAATYTWTNVSTGATGSGTLAASATTLSITGLPANAIIEVKINPINFQRININNGTNKARLVDVSQWGTTAWTSMENAFWGCNNLNITATDVPTLTGVTNMYYMFQACFVLNGPSNIGTWNTANVTNMTGMFSAAIAFNQNISTWNTAAVTNMAVMFQNAYAFNQPIGTWNVAAVTNMTGMFSGATAFNQNIGAWNTATVTNMTAMFFQTAAFNQDISAWNTIKVTSMESMFQSAVAFNQNIGTWNVAAVTNMSFMLSGATAFNQSLAAWGTKFNALVDLTSFLNNCGMSIANYEATLAGFALTTRTGRSLGALGLKYCNASARTILTNTVASGGKGWTITGDVQDCATATFVTRWDLSKTGASTTSLTFGVVVASTGAATYTWTNVGTGVTSAPITLAANATTLSITGLPANAIIEVKINPTNFQRINIGNGTDRARLVDVSQWGTTAWTSMANAFWGCNNLNITATDVPTLITVTDMSSMFRNCSVLNSPSNMGTWNTTAVTNMSSMFSGATAFNQNIGTWTTTAVTNMSNMFFNATAFNQPIGTWTTTAVTNMSFMFSGATAFNQNIGTWSTAAVTNMSSMFSGATAFNQNIGTWTTTAVTNMSFMFYQATAFNQPIGTWTTTAVTNMSGMLYDATAFNQNIGTWNVAAVTNMSLMFFNATAFNQSLAAWGTKFNAAVNLTNCLDNCGMSIANYEATLAGFASTTSTGLSLGALGLKYCNTSSRTILTNPVASGGKGWTITGDVQDCTTVNFVTRWDLSKTGASATALTFGVAVASTGAATYTWNTVPAGTSGSGTMAANATSVTITGLPAGAMIEVKINPTNFQRININDGTDKARLIDVSQWGTTTWTSMATAFYGCTNLNITATDVPNLAGVTNMSQMFFDATAFNQNISTWTTTAVTDMSQMFYNAKAFNQNISTWNVAAVTNMSDMFNQAKAFNQNISTWNVAAVTNMSGMFSQAFAFNQNIGTWTTTAVTNMSSMFYQATAFNQNIGTWTTTAVTNMSGMFYQATAFNGNIGTWNVAAVTNMSAMFFNATAFNQNIGTWNVAAVTNMSYMFYEATAFNGNIGTWNVAAVTNMSLMFYNATAFNQNIGTWNVAAVTNMSYMFNSATAFNQSLAAWGTKFNALVNLTNCLDYCGMSIANYEATLAGFALTTRTGRSLGAADLKYCNATDRTILVTPTASGGKGWTITGDVQDCAPGCACDPACNPIPTDSGTYTATTTNVIGGYTHYCDGIGHLLLSLKIPAGTTILPGSVSVKVGATAVTTYAQYCGASATADYCFMNVSGALINRNWYINPTFAGNVNGITAALANQLTVVSYFKNTDYTALSAAATVPNLTDIKLYYPKSTYSFGAFPSTDAIKPLLSISAYPNAANAGLSVWKLNSYQTNTIHSAEFRVGNIKNTGGLGKFQ